MKTQLAIETGKVIEGYETTLTEVFSELDPKNSSIVPVNITIQLLQKYLDANNMTIVVKK